MYPPENRLLAALPQQERARLIARMAQVTFDHRMAAYRAGGPIDFVYFPRGGLMSSVVVMHDGASAEVAAVGSEGMLGLSAFLGATQSVEQVFCQIGPCPTLRLPAAEFAAEVARGGCLQQTIYAYARGVLATSTRLIACNCLHAVEARCARWLLMSGDHMGSDEFTLTHEFLATMLGVRRASVTVAAGTHQAAGLIAYRHGKVKILDRLGLEQVACECYAVVRDAIPTTRGVSDGR